MPSTDPSTRTHSLALFGFSDPLSRVGSWLTVVLLCIAET